MISKLIRNMSTPSRIPLMNKTSNFSVDSNVSSYSYMYRALINYKNKDNILNINKIKKTNGIKNLKKLKQNQAK